MAEKKIVIGTQTKGPGYSGYYPISVIIRHSDGKIKTIYVKNDAPNGGAGYIYLSKHDGPEKLKKAIQSLKKHFPDLPDRIRREVK